MNQSTLEPDDSASSRTIEGMILGAPAYLVVVAVAVVTGLIWVMDWTTGAEISFSIFYFGPLGVATWRFGLRAGIASAIVCSAAWLQADWFGGATYSHPYIAYWNGSVRLFSFLIFAYLLAALHRELTLQQQLARTDPLTGLANRRHFLEVTASEIARSGRYGHTLSLAYLDLDGFKQINDQFGHPEGDAVLMAMAGVLQSTLRRPDVAARLGGDEFGILLPETGELQLDELLQRLQGEFLTATSNRGWAVTVSGGAVAFLDSPRRVDRAIAEVDGLLYEAKRAGKGLLLIKTWRRDPNVAASGDEHQTLGDPNI
ncbi:MAG: GGDEF domain-containing protein [Thermoanaerobaculia bacterium]|nr:GGDEF domain-containing protein [Thermoanaerobaculia bacterium]